MTMKTSPVSKQKHRSRRSSSKNHSPKPAIRKSSAERRERQQTLNKLREMVGGDENSSQLEIMQVGVTHLNPVIRLHRPAIQKLSLNRSVFFLLLLLPLPQSKNHIYRKHCRTAALRHLFKQLHWIACLLKPNQKLESELNRSLFSM